MKKITTLLLCLLLISFAFGKSVTMEKASQVANNYSSVNPLKSGRSIANSFSKSYNGVTTYYVFNYTGGGFVVVSADDVAIPVLADSDEGFVEDEITSPEARYWFDNYSREIAAAITSGADNTGTVAEWNKILNNSLKSPLADVAPLLKTTWDQGQYYNYYCPPFTGTPNSGGKSFTGCVATTMAQIMKFYNFPATGVGSHSFNHPLGTCSASFGTTNYIFDLMGNTATSSIYKEIATLMFHAGVSVDMGYATAGGSGASIGAVSYAMSTFFNYDNSTLALAFQSNYTLETWKALLVSELEAQHPILYSGSDPVSGGHAWVCDGYRSADSKFHMNWGWSGKSNGYFTISALNTPNGNFNEGQAIVYGIKPGNPDLIVRFTDLEQFNSISLRPTFDINCSVVKGTPNAVNLYINNKLVYTTTQTNFAYPWNTAETTIGKYVFRIEAIDATDTVYQEVNIGLSEWKEGASGFSATSRGIKYMHAVDSNVVWGTAIDASNYAGVIQDFTKTIDGGKTWTSGKIKNCDGLEPAMIFAINKDTAYVPMYLKTGTKFQGIYVTRDGGAIWARQPTAKFVNAASFPNVVHFFNKNDGFCMGDPINGDFEIYTTSNGGTTWALVPVANIANPLTGESGVVGYYNAVGDKAWFGTNMGRVYRSSDKGLHWDVSHTTLGRDVYTDIAFRDTLNGLAQNKSGKGTFAKTNDGGVTWKVITSTGYVGGNDFCYVPGTDNTWVTTGLGAAYSYDGGHSWARFEGTETSVFLSVDFANNHTGWAGSYNTNATIGGVFNFTGVIDPARVFNPALNLIAQSTDESIQLNWSQPETLPLSYNIYRNDTLIGNSATLVYHDNSVAPGLQNYCVTSVYVLGESPKICTTASITLGLKNTDEPACNIYPNPARNIINVTTSDKFNEVRIINSLGKVVYRNNVKGANLQILTEGFEPGMYFMQINTGKQVISKKVTISR